MTRSILIGTLAAGVALTAAGQADAGAVVGAAAGHFVGKGHAKSGAVVGARFGDPMAADRRLLHISRIENGCD